ncbi:MAG: ECF transporter S component [Ruminococcaceae bacterium]|nr:ECF transporter S component [Oscillospiraceae bacterium]
MSNLNKLKPDLTTKKLVVVAMLVSMSYVVSLFEFPIFPATPYLKLDFGNVLLMLAGFIFGPVMGVLACIAKELLSLIGTSSGGAGQVANMIMSISYIIVPSVVYCYKKGLKTVIMTLAIACLLGTVTALVANRFIVFPLYMKDAAPAVFKDAFWYVAAFNLIKTVSVSILTIPLYKRLKFIKQL